MTRQRGVQRGELGPLRRETASDHQRVPIPRQRIDAHRRSALLRLGAALLAITAQACSSSKQPSGARQKAATTITVLNWQGYGTDEPWALKDFRQRTGIDVKHDYFSNGGEMLTKLQTNPAAYDVVLVNSAYVRQLAGRWIDAVDLSKVSNAASLEPLLRLHPNLLVEGKPYGVAWLWGMTAIGVRKGKLDQGASVRELAAPRWKERFAMNDDPMVAVALGALMSGQDINAPRDLNLVREMLRSLKPNIRLLWQSEDEWNKGFAADQFDISLYWSGASVRSLRHANLPVAFVVPKEGPIGWLDTLAVPAASRKKEAAAAFINYLLDPGFYVEWATKIGAPAAANAAAMASLPADDLSKAVHSPNHLKTMQVQGPLSDEQRSAFTELWAEVKASYAR